MAGVLRRHTIDAGKAVKYTPCANKGDQTDEEELEEIAVVSKDDGSYRADEDHDHSGGGGGGSAGGTLTANGPRILPGPGIYQTPSDRTKLIGERLSSSGKINLSSPVYSGKVVEQKSRSTSKQSLLEIVSNRIGKVTGRNSRSYSKDEVAFLNKARSNETMTSREVRKVRRKDIADKFGKNKQRFERMETSSSLVGGCKWTFVFDPSGRLAYWWSFVVSIAFLYNFWVIIYRTAFEEINAENQAVWFTLDYSADLLYILDIAFHFRTGYLEDGVLQTDATKLRIHYMNSTVFYVDCLCLLPLDALYLSIGIRSLFRSLRLVKIYRFWAFIDRTERHTNYPNMIRTITLLHYLFAIYHWNACLLNMVVEQLPTRNDESGWLYSDNSTDVIRLYLHSLYWSTLTLTTIGDMPRPKSLWEYIFVIIEYVFGLLLFSTILGHVANIVANISAARKDFQAKLDAVKTYMSLRRVPLQLQDRVIRWFDYLWLSKKSSDEEKTMFLLPDKLKAEIALHIHLDTLKRVDIFQNTEAGFLCELVLRLRPVLFSPGDYICRKGEVGKEMYIVNRGRLQVVADNGKTVLATLRPGSYFGEISILNMGAAGNRRTASVRSVGYSDLFCLSKQDLWDVLKEYPAARVRLEAIAVKRLEKYKKAPLEKASISRSKSTPGQLESSGKIPIQAMLVPRHNTLPVGLLTPMSSQISPDQSEASESVQSALSATSNTANGSHHSGSLHAHAEMGGIDNGAVGGCEDEAAYSASPYSTETSAAQKSPVTNDSGRSFLSTPLSPKPGMSPVPLTNVQEAGLGPGDAHPPARHSSSPAAHPSASVHFSPHAVNKDDPFAGAPFHPHLGATGGYHHTHPASGGGPNMPAVHASHQPAFSFGDPGSSALMASTSSGSLRDPSQEILLQEITRLRERLATLETENTTMSIKLNQQQWEVEHRLAEIEMHICGSDSVGSQCSDEKSNKESVI